MITPEELKARREKYGYAVTVTEVFRDLDVVVLDSRGDHIQKVLDMIKLPNAPTEPKTGTSGRHSVRFDDRRAPSRRCDRARRRVRVQLHR